MRPNYTFIEAVAADLRAYMGEDFDEAAFADTLDGETDFADLADAVLERMQDDEALAEATGAIIGQLAARRDRLAARIPGYKAILLRLLDAAGLSRLERPRGLVSRRKGSVSVRIIPGEEADIPTQLMRETVTRAPDKIAIKAQLEAGERVPGAELVRGPDSVTVKVS